MNSVQLVGRLTSDVEIRTTPAGKEYAYITIATRYNAEYTNFVDCVAWGQTAQFAKKYFSKGDYIAVTGHVKSDRYQKDGQTYYTQDIVIDSIYFCENKKTDSDFIPAKVPEGDLPF